MESINWFAWVHLQVLIKFRESGVVNAEKSDWLDSEIYEMKCDLGIEVQAITDNSAMFDFETDGGKHHEKS